MIRRVRDLEGLTLTALDGHAGRIKDVYFDDETWQVRYLVADTSPWPTGIHVAIPPRHVAAIDVKQNRIEVDLTRLEIERNPVLDSALPVSAQLRTTGVSAIGRPMYWGFGAGGAPAREALRDAHLRSARYVTGFRVQATDGQLGHVIDLLVNDEDWTIPYLMTDTTHWRMGRPRLLSTGCVERIELAAPQVLTRISREEIESAPAPASRHHRADLPEVGSECRG
jgi:hypothetical protein